MIRLPSSMSGLTVAWMQEALDSVHPSAFPPIRDITVENIGSGIGYMADLLRCHLEYAEQPCRGPPTVIVKLPSPVASIRRLSRHLSFYRREYEFYDHIAGLVPFRSPALLYGDFDRRSHDFVLILEDLGSMRASSQIAGASESDSRMAIRSVAAMHGRFWNRINTPPATGFFDGADGKTLGLGQIGCALSLAGTFDLYGDMFTARTRKLTESWVARAAEQIREVASGPRTFIHGDYRLDNMLFSSDDEDELVVLDWQCSGSLGGLMDAAYFMATSVRTSVRRRIERDLLREYHDIVCSLGAGDFSFEECWRLYRQAVLACLGVVVVTPTELDGRSRRLGETIVRRVLMTVEDLDAEEFLPDRRKPTSRAGAFSLATVGAYRFSRIFRRRGRL